MYLQRMLMQAVDELAMKLFRAEAELQRALETEVKHTTPPYSTPPTARTHPPTLFLTHSPHPSIPDGRSHAGAQQRAGYGSLARYQSRGSASPKPPGYYIHAYFRCCLYQVFLKWFDSVKNVTDKRKQIARSRPLNHRLVGHPHRLHSCLNHRSQQL